MISIFKCIETNKPIGQESVEKLLQSIKSPHYKTKKNIEDARSQGKDWLIKSPRIITQQSLCEGSNTYKVLDHGILSFDSSFNHKIYKKVSNGDILSMDNYKSIDLVDGQTSYSLDDWFYVVIPETNKLFYFTIHKMKYGETIKHIAQNYYEYIKTRNIRSVSWNCILKDFRKKENVVAPSGYIYLDIDNFNDTISWCQNNGYNHITTKEQASDYVYSVLTNIGIGFIKAVWRSLNYIKGFGALAQCTGLTLDNFTDTWYAIQKLFSDKGVFIDCQTKDIIRANVISYDPNIFIRNDNDIIPFTAVNDIARDSKEHQLVNITGGVANSILSNIFKRQINNKANICDNRLTYYFFQKYFSMACDAGIDKKQALDFLTSKEEQYPIIFNHRDVDEVDGIADGQYRHFSSTFGHRKFLRNQPFDGNSQWMIGWVFNKNFKKNKINDTDIIERVCKQLKIKGILDNQLIDYLSSDCYFKSIDNISNQWIEIIERVYSNDKISFGLGDTWNESSLSEYLKKYIEKNEKNGYKIIKVESFNGDLNNHLIQLNQMTKQFIGELSDDNKFNFFGFFFDNCLSFGIDLDLLVDFINISFPEFDKFAMFIAKRVYIEQKYRFGIRKLRKLTHDDIKNRFNITKTLTIKNGSHISDLNITPEHETIIHGDTGQGKTTWICEKMTGKRIILVPVIPSLQSIENDYDAAVYYGNGKTAKDGDNLIVCTYSSFPNLYKQMQNWENKPSEYELHFDEYHNFAASGSQEYRGFELNFIVAHSKYFKKFVCYTGTNFPVLHPKLSKLSVCRTKWEKTPEKRYELVRYTDIKWSIATLLDLSGKNVIYLQSKKMDKELGLLIETLKLRGIAEEDIACINADEKQSVDFKNIVKNHLILDNIKVIICTSVAIEAISIYNEDIKTIHFYSPEHPLFMEQFVNRFRNVFTSSIAKCNCIIYIYEPLDKKLSIEKDDFDVVQYQKQLIAQAEKMIAFMQKPYTIGGSISHKMATRKFKQDIFGKSALFRVDELGQWVVDYLSCANISFNEERKYCVNNREFMQLLLSEYNWVCIGKKEHTSELSSPEKNSLKIFKNLQLKTKAEICENIIDDILLIGENQMIDSISDDKIKSFDDDPNKQINIDIRSKIKWLCSYMEFKDAVSIVKNWALDGNMSDRIWKKIYRQTTVKSFDKLLPVYGVMDISSDESNQMIELFKRFKNHQRKTFKEEHIIDGIKQHTGMDMDINTALSHCRKYFEVDSILVGKNVQYKIGGSKFSNEIYTFNVRIRAWIKSKYDDGYIFSSQEICDVLNDFRKDLPNLSGQILTKNNAMQLLQDYCTIKSHGKTKWLGQKINGYKIVDLDVKELSSIKINPFRGLDIRQLHYDDLNDIQREYLNKKFNVNQLIAAG